MIFKNKAHFKIKLNALIAAAVKRRGNPYPPLFHPKRHFVLKNEKSVSFSLVIGTSMLFTYYPRFSQDTHI